MKRKLALLLLVVAALVCAGCDNPMSDDDGAKDSSTETSRLVIVNGTDVVMLSVYMRPQGTSDWGPNLLAQCTPTGNLPVITSYSIHYTKLYDRRADLRLAA